MRAARRVKRAPATGHQRRRASHIKHSRQEHFFLLSLDMLCIAGFDGYFKQLNPAWEKTLGFTREELTAKPFVEFVHPDDRAATVAEAGRLMAGAETVTFENRYLTRDGSYKWLLWSTAVSLEDQLYYAVARDVTERKRADEALRLAKHETDRANRAKSEFLSRMSHELRTPLNAILGFAQLMEMDSLRPDQRESVGHILKGGRHLLDLINEVLDIARIEAGRLTVSVEAVSVKEVLQEALDLITPQAASGDVRLTGGAAGILDRFVLADRQRLKQVLLNLLSNAVKYNRKGGTVALSSKEIAAGRLQIKVSDTGAGIAPERLERLFTPFERLGAEQTGVEGVGLGLALSKGLVEAMGGTLGVESALDRGSAFWVEFPVVDSPVMRLDKTGVPLPAQASPEIARPAQTVLYIEDNLPNLDLIRRLLVHRPEVKLFTATQGRQGLDLAREHHPHLVLLDLHLPDIPGDEILRRLRGDPETRQIPVVVISADATPGQIRRLLAAGAQAYLTKPLNVKKLLALLERSPAGANSAEDPGGAP
ncbi:MAG TPA: ATP-binding protein [bacterium]|nr:ATP-binding protein [bacterium]